MILVSRSLWDFINLAFVAYIEERSLWGKASYQWYTSNQEWVDAAIMALNTVKLGLFTVAYLCNLLKWTTALNCRKEVIKAVQCTIWVEIAIALAAVILSLTSASALPLQWHPIFQYFFVKPLIIAAYLLVFKTLQIREGEELALRTKWAFIFICQFITV